MEPRQFLLDYMYMYDLEQLWLQLLKPWLLGACLHRKAVVN